MPAPSGARRRLRAWGASSSPAIRPSARNTTRSAYAAATGSCVTMTTVWPKSRSSRAPRARCGCRARRWARRRTARPARRTSARAIATRCRCAAGELVGPVAEAVAEPDPRERLARPLARRAHARQPQRQLDVLRDGQRRQQVVGLEDEADVRAAELGERGLVERAERGAGELDAPAGRGLQARGDMQQPALAGPRRPHDRGEAVRGELDAHALQRVHRARPAAVGLADVVEDDREGFEHAASLGAARPRSH